jgi:cyclopropane fatty-acyl-phospholipid synthase-like methyltransferase
MGFYNDKETAQKYIEMAEGYDGRELVDILIRHLPPGAEVLELGMGPGKDLDMLGEHFQAAGSDLSEYFLERYRAAHPDADLLLLDAIELQTDRRFDAIYSNKVLHHISDEELEKSLVRQKAVLRDGGHILHSFWKGTGVEDYGEGLQCFNREADGLRSIVGSVFEVIEVAAYQEFEPEDSLYVLGRV